MVCVATTTAYALGYRSVHMSQASVLLSVSVPLPTNGHRETSVHSGHAAWTGIGDDQPWCMISVARNGPKLDFAALGTMGCFKHAHATIILDRNHEQHRSHKSNADRRPARTHKHIGRGVVSCGESRENAHILATRLLNKWRSLALTFMELTCCP